MSNSFYEETTSTDRDTATLEENDNILDQLKAVIGKVVKRPDIFINVPERPGVTLLISPNITQNQIRAWQKNAGSETKNGIDATKFACQVVGHTTRGVFLNGEEVFEGGKPFQMLSLLSLVLTHT